MQKFSILLSFFGLFTLLLYALTLMPQDYPALKYLVFASQLLYGNMCYDILKKMRGIPAEDGFWSFVVRIFGEAIGVFVIVIAGLLLAAKVFLLAYVGLVIAILTYGYLLVKVLPKLQLQYEAAIGRLK